MSVFPPNDCHDEAGGKLPQQSFDAALKAALHDVPVPVDLADRIIARLEAETPPEFSTGQMPVRPTGQTPAPRGRGRFVSRRVLIAAGSLALVMLMALSFFYLRSAPHEIAREELSGDVTSWLAALPVKNWRPMTKLAKGMEVDRAVIAQPRQWQSLSAAHGSDWSGTVTAIDLAPPTAPRAVLFVVRSNARFAVPSTPTAAVRLGLSSGYVGTAWQRSSGVLFVLVVETDRGQRLEDFLRKPAQA
ncbi:MAG: hypothetical protein JF612_05440 [Planctomycetia bacterium]|nr:hypothetical protein [Planctomycetia bacterium]